MKGNKAVLEVLADVLSAELTSVNQYFIHAKMQLNWGLTKLAGQTRIESIDEMKHADVLIERILFLEGTPDLQKYRKIKVGKSVEEQLKLDLEVEQEAVERLKKGITVCQEASDIGSLELLKQILVAEENHIDFLETQLEMIGQLGLQNYLMSQV